MNPLHPPALFLNARALRASILVVLKHVDELSDIIEGRTDAGTGARHQPLLALPDLRVDRPMLAVIWRGRTCYLGHTLPFLLIERLARRPGHYVRASQLLEELWDGPRAASTVRSAVSDLRTRLTVGGMADLAQLIDGSNHGHYGILVRRPRASSDSKPTASRQRANRPTA